VGRASRRAHPLLLLLLRPQALDFKVGTSWRRRAPSRAEPSAFRPLWPLP